MSSLLQSFCIFVLFHTVILKSVECAYVKTFSVFLFQSASFSKHTLRIKNTPKYLFWCFSFSQITKRVPVWVPGRTNRYLEEPKYDQTCRSSSNVACKYQEIWKFVTKKYAVQCCKITKTSLVYHGPYASKDRLMTMKISTIKGCDVIALYDTFFGDKHQNLTRLRWPIPPTPKQA